jgi:hypothetical protein
VFHHSVAPQQRFRPAFIMTIAKKLTTTFGAIGALVTLISGVSLSGIASLGHEVDQVGNIVGKKAMLCGQLQGFSSKMRGSVRGVILYSMKERDKPDLVSRCGREFREFSEKVKTITGDLDRLRATSDEQRAAAQVRAAVDDWQPVVGKITTLCGDRNRGGAGRAGL